MTILSKISIGFALGMLVASISNTIFLPKEYKSLAALFIEQAIKDK